MANNYDAWVVLKDERLRPFWERVEQHKQTQIKKLLKDKDISYAEAVNALDWVLALPEEFERKKNVDTRGQN